MKLPRSASDDTKERTQGSRRNAPYLSNLHWEAFQFSGPPSIGSSATRGVSREQHCRTHGSSCFILHCSFVVYHSLNDNSLWPSQTCGPSLRVCMHTFVGLWHGLPLRSFPRFSHSSLRHPCTLSLNAQGNNDLKLMNHHFHCFISFLPHHPKQSMQLFNTFIALLAITTTALASSHAQQQHHHHPDQEAITMSKSLNGTYSLLPSPSISTSLTPSSCSNNR